MLYLFGRLALSDSFYFNQDVHCDEQPEVPATRPAKAASRVASATAPGSPPLGNPAALASTPTAESGTRQPN